MYRSIFKQVLDVLFAMLLLVLLAPLFLLLTFLQLLIVQGNPFFIQPRPGKNAKIFKIIKFKTMKDTRDTDGNLLPDSQRITSFGTFMRSTSLDELPQLLNVFKGDMSFVGPRPLLPEYLPLYSEEQMKRHDVKPGITGWAQVNGRSAISWEQKFIFDSYYVEHISLSLDVKILLMTMKKVVFRNEVSHEGSTDSQRFKGNTL